MEGRVRSMTDGRPFRLIFAFAFPLMLGNLFQQFYTMTDTLIVGRVIGMDALAALGSVDWYNYLILSVIQALTQGFAILLAQDFGAGDGAHLKRAHAHSIRLCLLFTALFLVLVQMTLPATLRLLQIPGSIRPISLLYLRILFSGIPIQVLFNYCASALRSLGDSKTPLYAMLIASALNIGLDLLFILVFHWDVAGAAAATVTAQVTAAGIVLFVMRRLPQLRIAKSDYTPEKGLNRKLLLLSLPMVLQNVMISVGGMISMGVVNTLGVEFIAGYSATTKWIGVLEMAAVAYSYAVVTYMGQNYGAGRYDRIRQGYRASLLIALMTSLVLSAVFLLFGKTLTGMFLTGDARRVKEAGDVALLFMRILGASLPLLYLLYVTRAALQGIGDTFAAMLSGVAEFVIRIFMSLVMIHMIGSIAVLLCEAVAWVFADIVLCTAFFMHMRGMGVLSGIRPRRKRSA
ncbi:MAG: MATE family efflux transporter [Clostridia bacterium]|nr:MATE family efflux transporter [Clostridia bacterium]